MIFTHGEAIITTSKTSLYKYSFVNSMTVCLVRVEYTPKYATFWQHLHSHCSNQWQIRGKGLCVIDRNDTGETFINFLMLPIGKKFAQ